MRRLPLALFACSVLAGCSSGDNAGFSADSGGDVPTAVSPDTGPENIDAGIYPYYDASIAIAALANDLWLSCPTYTCAGDVPVPGGVVTVSCQMVSGGGHCTFDCSQDYAEQACVMANGICQNNVCEPLNGTGPVDAGAPKDAAQGG